MSAVGISFIDGFSCLTVRREERQATFAAYARTVSERILKSAPAWFVSHVTGREVSSAEEFAKRLLEAGKTVTLKSGVYSGRDFILNAARGDDGLMLVSRIEEAVDRGTFVRCVDRPWFAGLVRKAMATGVVDGSSSWRNLPILAETGTEGDIVIGSPSAGFTFPVDEQDVSALVAAGQHGIAPQTWKSFALPPLKPSGH